MTAKRRIDTIHAARRSRCAVAATLASTVLLAPGSAQESAPRPTEPARFTHEFAERALVRAARAGDRVTDSGVDYDQKPWGLLYQAISNSVGAGPDKFQLIYPFSQWNWPTEQAGFLNAAMYDFCSVNPQWSAVGDYSSSGDQLQGSYRQFLNVISPADAPPGLLAKIAVARDQLTMATNAYTTAYNQARSTYADDVVDNQPPFTEWLGTPPGKGWQTKITAADKDMAQAQVNFNALVDQANTPGLDEANAQFENEAFYSKLNGQGLSTFPKVPAYSVGQDATQWVTNIKAGNGPPGATMGFTNRDQSYDYSRTWAKGSAGINKFFWGVKAGASWERIDEFASDQELEVAIEFDAIETVSLRATDWYDGAFVRSMANGPFIQGYSARGGDGTQAVFGPKGFFGLVKTGMVVGYKPTFTIRTSQESFTAFKEKFKAASGLRIGPFEFGASGGYEKAGWEASEAGQFFAGTSTSETPIILGVIVSELPSGGNTESDTSTAAATTERLGYVLGRGWQPAAGNMTAERLRNIRVISEHTKEEVLHSPEAGYDGLVVRIPKPHEIHTGPNRREYYRILGVDHANGRPVRLRGMRFLGYSNAGSAEFSQM